MTNYLEELLAKTTTIYQPAGKFYIKDMAAYAEQMANYPIQAKGLFSPHIFAINFPYQPKTAKSIVVFYDTVNCNIIYIHTALSTVSKYFGKGDVPDVGNPVVCAELIEVIANRVLPNMGVGLTNQILTAIQDKVRGKVSIIPPTIFDLINKTPAHPSTLESMYPRMNDPIIDMVKALFVKYSVNQPLPSDIHWNKEKTWVFAGSNDQYPGRYIEIEIRHAMRRNDPGMEIRVLLPGYERRIFNYHTLLSA